MATVRHAFESLKDDPADTSVVGESKWNADHEVEGLPVDFRDYGAVGDGVADESDAWDEAVVALGSAGGSFVISPGRYLFSRTPTIDTSIGPVDIYAKGAVFTTTGAVSGLKISSLTATSHHAVYGLCIDQRDDTDARYGFDLIQAPNTRLYDCVVKGTGTRVGYAGYHLANSDAANGGTGSFWTRMRDCIVGGDGGASKMTYGVLLEGSANATEISGGQFGNCVIGVRLQNQDGQLATPNSCRISADFETCTTAISSATDNVLSNQIGPYIHGCRGETLTNFFDLTDYLGAEPSVIPKLSGIQLVSDVTNYIVNPRELPVDSDYAGITPGFPGANYTYTYFNPMLTEQLTLLGGDSYTALSVENGAEVEIGSLGYQGGYLHIGTLNGLRFDGPKPTITGVRNGNAALASILSELATLGFLTDSTTVGNAPNKYKSGVGVTNLADGDFTVTPADGATGVAHNTTDGKSYYCARANGTWKSVEVTA